ncbi:MAG: DUF2273 domain-containing protein [Clostridia bacterium]|nr:DUF2273 domain-containing protein [Clostridia bacterium]
MNIEKLAKFYSSHRGGFNGAFIGFSIAVAILMIGFFKTLFIAICVGLGYYIGNRISQDKDYLRNLLDRVLPPGTYR